MTENGEITHEIEERQEMEARLDQRRREIKKEYQFYFMEPNDHDIRQVRWEKIAKTLPKFNKTYLNIPKIRKFSTCFSWSLCGETEKFY